MKSLHHSFDIELAAEYGIECAIMIHHFQHWINKNKSLKRNFIENRTWSYQTLEEIASHFPYLNCSKVKDIIEKLCQGKQRKSKKDDCDFKPVLMKGNFNATKYDRTTWYSFVDEERFTILGNPKMESGKSQNGKWEIPTPIPDTITNNKTNIITPPNPLKGDGVGKNPFPKNPKTKKPPKEKPEHQGRKEAAKECHGDDGIVKLTPAEHTKLIETIGAEPTEKLIEQLNDYIASKGIKYKSHYHTILSWHKRRQEKPSFKPKNAEEAMRDAQAERYYKHNPEARNLF